MNSLFIIMRVEMCATCNLRSDTSRRVSAYVVWRRLKTDLHRWLHAQKSLRSEPTGYNVRC